ncbi:MAG TPA: hypothetical protein PLP14_08255, partial [Chitinophagaceae bacterium]|nr:hypothetical protein [Chitinophagaceae bacterium]
TVDADKKTSPSSENLPRSGEDIREQLHQLDEKIESLGRKSLKNEIINELRVSNERILQQVFQNKEDLRKEISGYFTNRNTGRDSFIKWLGVLNLLLSGLIIGYLLFQKTATPVVVPQYIPAQVAAPATAPPLASPVQPNEQRAETSPIAPAGSQIQSVRPQRNSRVKPVSVQEAPRIHSASTHATLSPAQPAPAEKREVTPVVRQTENTEPVYFGDDQP